jgi:hypothetical protein
MSAHHDGWWDTHDDAWRRARRLFALAARIATVYLTGIATIVVLVGAAIVTGDGDVVADGIDDVGALGAVLIAIGLLALAAAAIAAIGWRGLPRRTRRLSRAHPPAADDADRARSCATVFGLAYGIRAPTIWVIASRAPNALVFGRRSAGHIALTSGALALPPAVLEPLVMFNVTALTSRAYTYARSTVDLVLLGEWLTNLLWLSGAFAIVSTALGVPVEIAAVYVVSLAAVVLVTRPAIALAARELVGLLDEVDELVDLETIRQSNEPAAYAALLLTMLEDDDRVRSRWQIAHRWFERDVVETSNGWLVPEFVERTERTTRRDLIDRADVAVTLASDEQRLRTRLERVRRQRVSRTG